MYYREFGQEDKSVAESGENWYSLFKNRWLTRHQILFTYGGNLLRSFCFPATQVPSLVCSVTSFHPTNVSFFFQTGGIIPTVVQSANCLFGSENDKKWQPVSDPIIYGTSLFLVVLEDSTSSPSREVLYHFNYRSGELQWVVIMIFLSLCCLLIQFL